MNYLTVLLRATIMKLLIILFLYVTTAQSSPSVIIIGAGPSGIAAATSLLENQINVTVLEAEPRIGGRVKSVNFGDAYVDLGAEWCHGETGNIVYDLAKDLNILTSSNFQYQFYTSDRKDVDNKLCSDLHEIFEEIYSETENTEDLTVGDHFIPEYKAKIQSKYENNSGELNFSNDALECFQHYLLASEGTFSWYDASAAGDFIDCAGDLALNWNGLGYKTILEILMKKYPEKTPDFPIDDVIHKNKEVKKIVWDQNSVSLTCSDGTVYNADHVIFTPSLGVLKSSHEDLFSPPLPANKSEAITKAGIGAVMKVYVKFPESWWKNANHSSYFSLVWKSEDKQKLYSEFPRGPFKTEGTFNRSWLLDLFAFYPAVKNPNVLEVWFTGEFVPKIEEIPNETLLDGILFVLDRFIGHKYNITKPSEILRTDWFKNPHFKGTYSFQTVESRKMKPSSNLVLAEPLYNTAGVPTLLFAGEATHPHHYATVHGAIETGYREADRLLAYFAPKSELSEAN